MGWRRRGGLALALAVLIAGWGALVVMSGGHPDSREFDSALIKSAETALAEVRTAQLAGQAELTGRATRTFLTPVLDNALSGVVTAQQRAAQLPPPGPAETGTRDELLKLLDEAARATGDLVGAFQRGDRAGSQAAVGALGPIGDRLAEFVQRHRTDRRGS